jgi:hypothetical protein
MITCAEYSTSARANQMISYFRHARNDLERDLADINAGNFYAYRIIERLNQVRQMRDSLANYKFGSLVSSKVCQYLNDQFPDDDCPDGYRNAADVANRYNDALTSMSNYLDALRSLKLASDAAGIVAYDADPATDLEREPVVKLNNPAVATQLSAVVDAINDYLIKVKTPRP